ncbi:MAG: Maf family protein [Acidimicrobiia bacterium]
MKLVLASSSPRRRELLESLNLRFEVRSPEVDETRFPDETPGVYVERIARAKAIAVSRSDEVTVAADTTVVFEGRVMGKPGHPEEARSMLRRLQGSKHEVLTALAVSSLGETHSLVDATEVEMMPMTDEEIAAYVAGGEPMDKAGAYALQGEGGVFVTSIHGSPSTVVGLPIHQLPRLLARVGVELSQFRPR